MNKLELLRNKFKEGSESRIKNISDTKTQSRGLSNIEPKIIGISGSKGKSTIAYLIHQYLKSQGLKSVLYSSIGIDSPASFNEVNEAVENPMRDRQMIFDIIEESIEYNAEYIIMEVNERAIEKGYTKDIDFDIRLLSNIKEGHNVYFYSNYKEIKKDFFMEANPNTTLIYNASTKELFDELYNINTNKKVTYMSNYVVDNKEIDISKVDYILTSNEENMDTLNGLKFNVNDESFETNLLYPQTAINIMGVVAVLKELNVYNYDNFKTFIKDFSIPGRDEVIRVNNRTIIINTTISPHLKTLKRYQNRNEFNKLNLLVGAAGLGYVNWLDEYGKDKTVSEKEDSIEYAFNYLKKYVDSAYITVNDSGSTNKEQLLDYQASFIDSGIKVVKELDRKEAIKKILLDSNEFDVIYISGRGNRRVMCDSHDTFVFHLDKEVILETIKEIGWS